MLSRPRHGDPFLITRFFRTFTSSLLYSSFSSSNQTSISPNQITTHPQPKAKKSNSLLSPALRSSIALTPSLDVSTICSLLSYEDASSLNFDSLLRDYKTKLSSNLVLDVIRNYRHLGRAKTLEFFCWAGFQVGFQFDDSLIEYVVDFLGRRKLFDDMKCLLVTVSAHNGRISCRAYAICIRFLGRHGRVREALCLFEEMEKRFMCKPDNFVYNNMLYVLCKKYPSGELMDVAISIFKRIEHPDTYSFSNVLYGLCKFGRFETALEVFQDMGRAGLIPTRSALNVLIGDLCIMSAKEGSVEKVRVHNTRRPFTILVPNLVAKPGALDPAVAVFWAAYDMGLLPSAFVISRLISELCRLGKLEEAVKILNALDNRKISCLEECYSNVIKSLCENRLVAEACKLFGRMLSRGINPKLVIYNYVICMLCKVERLDEAEGAFEIMKKNRCIPDNVTYTALIHACGKANKWEPAYGLLMEMLALGICPHFNTYSIVDQLLKEHGRMDLSVKLEGKVEGQIVLKHCKTGDLEAAYEKLYSMLQKGLYPAVYIRDAFKTTFHKHGKAQMAQQLLDKMDEVQQDSILEPANVISDRGEENVELKYLDNRGTC